MSRHRGCMAMEAAAHCDKCNRAEDVPTRTGQSGNSSGLTVARPQQLLQISRQLTLQVSLYCTALMVPWYSAASSPCSPCFQCGRLCWSISATSLQGMQHLA